MALSAKPLRASVPSNNAVPGIEARRSNRRANVAADPEADAATELGDVMPSSTVIILPDRIGHMAGRARLL